MARNFSGLLRIFRWQYLRWGLAIPALPLALWACNSHPMKEPFPNPQMETDFSVLVTPEREVDILFMIDNSPSMDPKQKALAKNFPAMIEVLEKLEGGLPDIHVGVISSDFGAGSGELGANCGTPLGNRGLLWGNDDSSDTMAGISANGYNRFATVANQTNGCGLKKGARWISDIQKTNGAGRDQNYTGKLQDVFGCLASGVGVKGCGEEHPLQSIRIALNPQSGINDANVGFVRPKAYLAIVIIADEDDCSADPWSSPADAQHPNSNDGMFTPVGLTGETTSLRCAGRGHVCNGQAIQNYDADNGYTGQTPLSVNFADCAAKEPKDKDFHWMPLIPIQTIIDDVLGVKNKNKDKILVSGIIGWPKDNKLDGVKYRIDKDSTSIPASLQSLWDYMPICTLPEQKSEDGNIYKAYGGLRLKKFIDAFKGTDENVFSICNNDFSSAMTQIGNAIAQKLRPGCIDYPLIDNKPGNGKLDPYCQVMDRIPCEKGSDGCFPDLYKKEALYECKDEGGNPLDPNNTKTQLDKILESKRPCWYLSYDKDRVMGCPNAFAGQKISALRKSGTVAPPGTWLAMQCLTCPKSVAECEADLKNM